MAPPNPLLAYRELKASKEECDRVRSEWRARDRTQIRSYEAHLALRRITEAKLACSRAIAYLRCAQFVPYSLELTLAHHANWDRLPPDPTGWGATTGFGPPLAPPAGSWAAKFHAAEFDDDEWPDRREPAWDGVTRIPKSPHKTKRRRARKRAEREAYERYVEASNDAWRKTTSSETTWCYLPLHYESWMEGP